MKYTSVAFIVISYNNMGRYNIINRGGKLRFQHHVRMPPTVQHQIIY